MFIRTKKFGNGEYSYLVEAYRKDGKPQQRVIRYLGVGFYTKDKNGNCVPVAVEPAKLAYNPDGSIDLAKSQRPGPILDALLRQSKGDGHK